MPPPPKRPSVLHMTILLVVMLSTGISNSIFSKAQNMVCVKNCESADPSQHETFEQPVWQTATMFSGEMLCLVAFVVINSRLNPYRPKSRRAANAAARRAATHSQQSRLSAAPLSRPDESAFNFNESAISLRGDDEEENLKLAQLAKAEAEKKITWRKAILFWGPAACDICGTTAMNVGLLLVPVSIYQMLRGALVLWVGILSVLFLGRKLSKAQWTALATVMSGIAIVAASSLLGGGGNKQAENSAAAAAAEKGGASELAGVVLILVAQVFTASQFVLEEKIMERYTVEPMLAAGFEGLFGLLTTLSGLFLLNRMIGQTENGRGGLFDASVGWHQIISNSKVWGSSIIIAVSIALFNFCGLEVTKTLSATSRSTIDSSRTVGIWLVSLWLGWEKFKWLQVLGFVVLVYGTFVFNGIMSFPAWTGLDKEPIPSVVLPEEEDLEQQDSDEEDETESDLYGGRSRAVDSMGRPVTRRSGSGRRGEISPLLKNVVE